MNKIFIIFIGVIFFLLSNKSIDKKNLVQWCSERKLNWDDFLGTPDTINNPLADAAVFTSLEITKNEFIDGLPRLEVKSFFIKSKSWRIVNDSSTLAHEQLHFDIAEIYARKIRKAFDSLNKLKVNHSGPYSKVFSILAQEKNEYNMLYDLNVYSNKEKQKEWSLIVAKELEELQAYELKCNE
ncbi:hypothetical protein GOQ30_07600 [Flavobacterium sp. TP390]|uniref:DUF922 domain-containing protein n=1 Tax=Flavobacterium profundi TaxID=1774945 RepID=A0A6I4IHC1_9FLAO|nr:hypothetical protein [Flavobacterium profundi]MVO09030.1 hypothetical protein [Flavobacterium profundi]